MFSYNWCFTDVVLQRTTPMLGVTDFAVNDFFARRTMIPLESMSDPITTRREPLVIRPAAGLLHKVAATRDPWLKNFD